ncbi:putative Phospholipase C [Cocos nucifera]|uniref:Putative Phospholipase C n=1 Tax=Cocos nucifera TaxID=13894 RepID=A0A8K0HVI6_COCNU|nr:putative Phospholipase C [Cocos nucifera]
MGSNLCTYRKSNAAQLANHIDDSDDENTSVDGRNWVLEFLTPRCLSIAKEKKETDHQENIGEEKKPTLEEWFLFSPSFEADYSNAGGMQRRKQSPKVCPLTLTCDYERLSSTTSESSSIDGRMLGERSVPLSRSQSGQRKRVSFRLPEEADIHIIYCQDESEEGAVVGKE